MSCMFTTSILMGRKGGATQYGVLNYNKDKSCNIITPKIMQNLIIPAKYKIGGAYLPECASTTKLIDFSYYFQAILNEEAGGMKHQKSTAMKRLK